jgi:hypothetical protein
MDPSTSLDTSEEKSFPIRLNIGGTIYDTDEVTLKKFPETLLGAMMTSSKAMTNNRNEFFFDRDGTLFQYIINYYKTGKIEIPENVPIEIFLAEIKYWQLPDITEPQFLGITKEMLLNSMKHNTNIKEQKVKFDSIENQNKRVETQIRQLETFLKKTNNVHEREEIKSAIAKIREVVHEKEKKNNENPESAEYKQRTNLVKQSIMNSIDNFVDYMQVYGTLRRMIKIGRAGRHMHEKYYQKTDKRMERGLNIVIDFLRTARLSDGLHMFVPIDIVLTKEEIKEQKKTKRSPEQVYTDQAELKGYSKHIYETVKRIVGEQNITFIINVPTRKNYLDELTKRFINEKKEERNEMINNFMDAIQIHQNISVHNINNFNDEDDSEDDVDGSECEHDSDDDDDDISSEEESVHSSDESEEEEIPKSTNDNSDEEMESRKRSVNKHTCQKHRKIPKNFMKISWNSDKMNIYDYARRILKFYGHI